MKELLKEIQKQASNDKPSTEKPATEKPKSQLVEGQLMSKFSELYKGEKGGLSAIDEIKGEYINPDRMNSAQEVYGAGNKDYLDGDEYLNNIDVDEVRAQRQGWSGRMGAGLGRLIPKIGAEIGKSVGYIGGAIPALATWDLDWISDNATVKLFEGMEESVKEALPVYVRNSVENGDFWEKTFSSEFFANEGIDGVGFLVAAMASGYGLGAASRGMGVGAKIANGIGKGKKAEGIVNNLAVTFGQTVYEAGSEMRGTEEELKRIYDGYERTPDGRIVLPETDENGDQIIISEEEAAQRINDAGRSTFWLNATLLMATNYIQTDMLFGNGSALSKGTFAKLDDISSPEAFANSLSKLSRGKETMIVAGANMRKGIINEGFEEWSQFAIGDYSQRVGKGEDINVFEGLLDGMIEGATTIEGQQSIFLGSILGMGPGAIGAVKQVKRNRTQREGLSKILLEGKNAFNETLDSFIKKKEDGTQDLKDGKVQIDITKLLESLESTEKDIQLSQKLAGAMLTKNPKAIKNTLMHTVYRRIAPYLGQEGGSELWNMHVDSMVEEMTPEGLEALNFKSKKEYATFLKEIGEKATKTYDKVSDRGPAFYGIQLDEMLAKEYDISDKAKNELISQFIKDVENTAVLIDLNIDAVEQDLTEISQELATLKQKDNKQVLEEDESLTETLEKTKEFRQEAEALTKTKKDLEQQLEILKNAASEIYNKPAQQKAFEDRLKEIKDIEEAQVKDEVEIKEKNVVAEEFYQNLRDKGYNITENNIKDSDFGKGAITLKDDEGNVYRVIRKFNPKTKVSDYFIVDYETNKQIPFTLDVLTDLGLNKPENIMSKEDFKEWSTARRTLKKNAERLTILRKVVRKHFDSRKKKKNRIQELQDSLAQYEESLEGWKQLDPNMSVDSVIEEIITLESKIDLVKNEISSLEAEITELNNALGLMGEMQNELLQGIENNTEFSFGIKLLELKKQIEEGDWETDLTIVQDAIDWNTELSKELSDRLKPMQDALDSLYETIFKIQDIENILKGTKIPYYLQRLIMEVMPDVELDGNVLQDLRPDQRYQLLNDPKIRLDVFKALKREKSQLMGAYMVTRDIVNEMKAEYKDIQEELKKLTTNKVLVTKYNKLVKGYDALQTVKFGTDITKKYEAKKASDEQDDIVVDEEVIKKSNSKSTSSNIYKGKYVNGVFVPERDKAGNKVLNDNYKQGARWDEVAGSIPLDQLDNYGFRFVTNAQLSELGVTPPSDKIDDLYAVLYDRATDKPVEHSDGTIIFTGVPFTETMFQNNGKTSIDIERTPEYLPYKDVVIDENNTVIYNEEEFDDRADLIEAIQNRLKEEYDTFRTSVLEESKKETAEVKLYGISDISAGMPIYDNVKKKLSEVVDVAEVVVANSDTMTKENNAQMEVIPGRVYVKTKSGQMIRAMNYKIMDLSEKEKADMLNKIIGFIAMAKAIPDGNFRTAFKFAGNTNESIPFRGDEATAGVLDYFINWGISNDKPYGIDIFSINNDPLSGYELRFKMENKSEKLKLDELFDENGNVKDYTDLSILPLVSFLENKYLNVNSNALKESKSVKIPKAFDPKSNTITYDTASTIDDYYLNNYLYTNIKKYDSEVDETPNFVNRYASYNTSELPAYVPKVVENPKTEAKRSGNSLQQAKSQLQNNKSDSKPKNSLQKGKERVLNKDFDSGPPLDEYNDFDQGFVSQDTSTMDSMFAQHNPDAFTEKNEKKTTCETGGKQIKKLGNTRRKKK